MLHRKEIHIPLAAIVAGLVLALAGLAIWRGLPPATAAAASEQARAATNSATTAAIESRLSGTFHGAALSLVASTRLDQSVPSRIDASSEISFELGAGGDAFILSGTWTRKGAQQFFRPGSVSGSGRFADWAGFVSQYENKWIQLAEPLDSRAFAGSQALPLLLAGLPGEIEIRASEYEIIGRSDSASELLHAAKIPAWLATQVSQASIQLQLSRDSRLPAREQVILAEPGSQTELRLEQTWTEFGSEIRVQSPLPVVTLPGSRLILGLANIAAAANQPAQPARIPRR